MAINSINNCKYLLAIETNDIHIFSFSCSGSTLQVTLFTSFWKGPAEQTLLLGESLQNFSPFKMQWVGFKLQNFRHLQSKRVMTGSCSWRVWEGYPWTRWTGLGHLPWAACGALEHIIFVGFGGAAVFFFQFKSSLNAEIIAWQPTRVLLYTLQGTRAQREACWDAWEAFWGWRQPNLVHCSSRCQRSSSCSKWSLLRLGLEAISSLTPRESQEWRNKQGPGSCRRLGGRAAWQDRWGRRALWGCDSSHYRGDG